MCTSEALHDLNISIQMLHEDLSLLESGNCQVTAHGEDVTQDWFARLNVIVRRLEWIAQSHRADGIQKA